MKLTSNSTSQMFEQRFFRGVVVSWEFFWCHPICGEDWPKSMLFSCWQYRSTNSIQIVFAAINLTIEETDDEKCKPTVCTRSTDDCVRHYRYVRYLHIPTSAFINSTGLSGRRAASKPMRWGKWVQEKKDVLVFYVLMNKKHALVRKPDE